MRSPLRAAASAAAATTLAAGVVAAVLPRASVDVHFSPGGGCTAALVREVDAARKSVRVLSYGFTSTAISDALIRARARGVDVRLVLDRSNLSAVAGRGDECQAAGIPVLYDGSHAIAHNKVVIVDGMVTAGGSFNHTASAELHNAENLTVIRSAAVAARFAADWELHRGHSRPAPAPTTPTTPIPPAGPAPAPSPGVR